MASISWKSAQSGDWSNGADWSTGVAPTASDDATITPSGSNYEIDISTADKAKSLTVSTAWANLFEDSAGGSLTLGGALTVDAGLVNLGQFGNANAFGGGVTLNGGELDVGNADALGGASLSINGGRFGAFATETLADSLAMSGTFGISAFDGATLTIGSGWGLTEETGNTVAFGYSGSVGVVVLDSGGAILNAGLDAIDVAGGTLKGGDQFFQFIFKGSLQTTVEAGATIDVAGFNTAIPNLLGSGTVTDSGAAATLTLAAPNFAGAISGPLSVTISGSSTLSGANSYTGATTISSGATLSIGALNGTTGSIGGGAIVDNGSLNFRLGAGANATLTNGISGAGGLFQIGSGALAINQANTQFTGASGVTSGTLAIGHTGALGFIGQVSVGQGGTLLGTATETLINPLEVDTTATIAAAHGATLTIGGGNWTWTQSQGGSLTFGASGQDGVIVWLSPSDTVANAGLSTLNVAAGTLKGGDANFNDLTTNALQTTVQAGATLDTAGRLAQIVSLQGAGTVTSSLSSGSVQLSNANFAGTLTGALSAQFFGTTTLSGTSNYTGSTGLVNSALTDTGAFDIVSDNGVFGDPGTSFDNKGVFEKTGGAGASQVTTSFTNDGAIVVDHGALQFTAGFTNNGAIHGLVSTAAGTTTVTAATRGDFNGDSASDVLFLNPNGALAMWEMNNTQVVGGGVFEQISPGWTVSGIGDFNGDGTADILLSTAAGALAMWEMNGVNVIGGGPIGSLGSGWNIAGVGDFNGDGLADILFQNANGALGMWEMNGTKVIGGSSAFESLGANSGWSVVGTGDFNADGNADVLLQNTNGSVALWEMNGVTVIGGGVFESLGANSGWNVVGAGDFNGDGRSDVLLENANGAVAMWEMNGTSVIGGGVFENLGANSGWSVAGVGDYNGDGKSDILLHNTNGATSIWDMNGAQVIGGGGIGAIPSPWILQHA